MNSLRTTGIVSRPHVIPSFKSISHFSPLTWKLASIRFSRSSGFQTGTVILRAAMASTDPSTELTANTQMGTETEKEKVELACPVCYRPVSYSGFQSPNLLTAKVLEGSLRCSNCQKSFKNDRGIIDLTIPSEGGVGLGASFFQNPLIAFVYERGYRSLFALGNFPGFDEEADMAQRLLETARGEVVMDLSCGPGAFTRRFLAGGAYKTVIASDYSQAMLEQCRGFLEGDVSVDLSKVVLVRADAARLPFATASVAGVHAGAAIHCWPNISTSVAEISRILQPGGIFIASTFIPPTPSIFAEGALKSVRKTVDQLQLPFNWLTEGDLRAVTEACGLVNWYTYKRGMYFLFAVSKPL